MIALQVLLISQGWEHVYIPSGCTMESGYEIGKLDRYRCDLSGSSGYVWELQREDDGRWVVIVDDAGGDVNGDTVAELRLALRCLGKRFPASWRESWTAEDEGDRRMDMEAA